MPYSVSQPIIWVLTQCLYHIICLLPLSSPIPTSSSCPYSVSQPIIWVLTQCLYHIICLIASTSSPIPTSSSCPYSVSQPIIWVLTQCLYLNHLSNCLYLITDPYLFIMSLFSVSTHHLSLNSMPLPHHLSNCLYLITDPYLIICPYSVSQPIIWVLTQCLYLIICLIASTSSPIPTSSLCPYSVSQPIIWVLTQCLYLIICLIASTSSPIPTSSLCPYSVSQPIIWVLTQWTYLIIWSDCLYLIRWSLPRSLSYSVSDDGVELTEYGLPLPQVGIGNESLEAIRSDDQASTTSSVRNSDAQSLRLDWIQGYRFDSPGSDCDEVFEQGTLSITTVWLGKGINLEDIRWLKIVD